MLRHWLKTVKSPALVLEIFTTGQQFILDGASAVQLAIRQSWSSCVELFEYSVVPADM